VDPQEKPIADEIVARQFRLVDSRGRDRAILTARWNDEPQLLLLDERSCPRITLKIENEKPFVTLHAPDGDALFSAGVDQDHSVGLIIKDFNGRPRVWISARQPGETTIRLFDSNGEEIWSTELS